MVGIICARRRIYFGGAVGMPSRLAKGRATPLARGLPAPGRCPHGRHVQNRRQDHEKQRCIPCRLCRLVRRCLHKPRPCGTAAYPAPCIVPREISCPAGNISVQSRIKIFDNQCIHSRPLLQIIPNGHPKFAFAPYTLTSIPRSRTIYSGSPFSFLPEPGVFLFELADAQISFFELQP